MAFRSSNEQSMERSPSPPGFIQPRRLRFLSPKKAKIEGEASAAAATTSSLSPPYRKVQALRLFENSPATPKTILQKSSGKCMKNHLSAAALSELQSCEIEVPRPLPLHNRALDNFIANVNPFTPDSLLAHNKKRCRTQFGRENQSLHLFLNSEQNANGDMDADQIEQQAPKRLALQDTNISRYRKEFLEISLIGVGEFGLVYQCLNRLDGCIYAIKKSIKPVAGSFFEKRALNEVWAHAVLGKHDNVVRYYSAWAEDDHMLIQNEYCNGGSLQALLQKRCLVESELKILLLHVAEGLRYIHSNDLVHMDLKAGNIFLTSVSSHKTAMPAASLEYADDGMAGIYEELTNTECIITYKIGDLGHVTSVNEPKVEEGDCRYLPNEILQENFSDLFKADIFALGITLYEAAGGGPLPKNGPEWHQLRNGAVPRLSSLSAPFNELIQLMTHPDPAQRPTSTSIFNHSILSSLESKSKLQLSQELAIEKRKNEILLRKLREARGQLKTYEERAAKGKNGSPKTEPRLLRSYTRTKRSLPATALVGGAGSGAGSNNNRMDELRDRNKNTVTINNNLKF